MIHLEHLVVKDQGLKEVTDFTTDNPIYINNLIPFSPLEQCLFLS